MEPNKEVDLPPVSELIGAVVKILVPQYKFGLIDLPPSDTKHYVYGRVVRVQDFCSETTGYCIRTIYLEDEDRMGYDIKHIVHVYL